MPEKVRLLTKFTLVCQSVELIYSWALSILMSLVKTNGKKKEQYLELLPSSNINVKTCACQDNSRKV